MLIRHTLSLDLRKSEVPERIHVKQGDTLTHQLQILLYDNGESWPIPADVTPVVRWFACDPDSGESARGIYDTLPNGVHAWNYTQNQLDLQIVPQMFALPGVVQADVVFVSGEKSLATFNFEFYVNRAPANGTEPEAQSYYRVASLEQINASITALQTWQASVDGLLAHLERRVYELEHSL